MKRESKYGNRRGGGFDSRREQRRYQELLLLQRAGKITGLVRQQAFELIPAQRDESGCVIERAVKYVADFCYVDPDTGAVVVEDAKGFRTKDYIIKRKLMLWVHHIRVKEV